MKKGRCDKVRAFIAINFSQEVKEYLLQIMSSLQQETIKGNFTRPENLHLTLAFLGEMAEDKLPVIKEIMNEMAADYLPFDLVLQQIGKFITRGGSLYWCGVRKNEALSGLQSAFSTRLKQSGFVLDEKAFQPHITLGRQCIMKSKFNESELELSLEPMHMMVTSIHLMESKREHGILTYTSRYEKRLRGRSKHDEYTGSIYGSPSTADRTSSW